jgi:hypothetical protein
LLGVVAGLIVVSGAAVPAQAAAGGTVAGYATITDEMSSPGEHQLPSSRVFSTSGGGASVHRLGVGIYEVRFHNLAVDNDPWYVGGVVHARSLVANGPTCDVTIPWVNYWAVWVDIHCRQAYGPPTGGYVDTPFTVSYTNGVAETGGLAFARVDGTTPLGATAIPAIKGSSVPGQITSLRYSTGRYIVDMPTLGTKRTVAVTGTIWTFPATVGFARCNLANNGQTFSSGITRFAISCVGPDGVNKDTNFNITYADGVNLLGKLNQVSEAYGYIPANSPNGSDQVAALQYDKIYGVSGVVKFHKNGGSHVVVFGRQGIGIGNPVVIVTPVDSNAYCYVAGTNVLQNGGWWDLVAFVNCTNGTTGFFAQAWMEE